MNKISVLESLTRKQPRINSWCVWPLVILYWNVCHCCVSCHSVFTVCVVPSCVHFVQWTNMAWSDVKTFDAVLCWISITVHSVHPPPPPSTHSHPDPHHHHPFPPPPPTAPLPPSPSNPPPPPPPPQFCCYWPAVLLGINDCIPCIFPVNVLHPHNYLILMFLYFS